MTPGTYDTDAVEAAEDKAYREWWRKPDPFDPNNAPDPDDDQPDEETDMTDRKAARERLGAISAEHGDGQYALVRAEDLRLVLSSPSEEEVVEVYSDAFPCRCALCAERATKAARAVLALWGVGG